MPFSFPIARRRIAQAPKEIGANAGKELAGFGEPLRRRHAPMVWIAPNAPTGRGHRSLSMSREAQTLSHERAAKRSRIQIGAFGLGPTTMGGARVRYRGRPDCAK